MNEPWQSPAIVAQTGIIARSYHHFTKRDLLPPAAPALSPLDFSRAVFAAPLVLVSHGIEDDPILNYGNATALRLWEMTWEELTRTPSRLTAEAPNREERARLLGEVTRHGFIDDYSGIRISKNGRRFRIRQATVWNLIAPDGTRCGQAAMFSNWEFL